VCHLRGFGTFWGPTLSFEAGMLGLALFGHGHACERGVRRWTSMDNRENGLGAFVLAIFPNFTSLTRVVPGPSAALASDPKYKKYTQQVEKCLATFDSVHEWADFIAFLTKLLKVIVVVSVSMYFHTDVVVRTPCRPFKAICSIKKFHANS